MSIFDERRDREYTIDERTLRATPNNANNPSMISIQNFILPYLIWRIIAWGNQWKVENMFEVEVKKDAGKTKGEGDEGRR